MAELNTHLEGSELFVIVKNLPRKVEKCVTYLGAFGGKLTRLWALLNASLSIYLQYASVLWCVIDIVIHINYNNTYFVSTIMIWVDYMDYLYSIVYPTQKINQSIMIDV